MQEELLSLIAARQGHFRLESGHHGSLWLDLDPLFVRPGRLRRILHGALLAEPVLREIRARLRFMIDVGLDYLDMSRPAGSLSGCGAASRRGFKKTKELSMDIYERLKSLAARNAPRFGPVAPMRPASTSVRVSR